MTGFSLNALPLATQRYELVAFAQTATCSRATPRATPGGTYASAPAGVAYAL